MTEPPSKKPKTEGDKSKAYQYKNKRRHFFEVGQKGFLATCNFREKDCVRECYNILSQYADELYGPEPKNDANTDQKPAQEEEPETDIADDLQKEIDDAKEAADPGRSRRFQAVDTGTKNCVFIKTTLNDPVELGTMLIKDIAKNKIQKARYLLRLIPIDAVCKANVDDITKAGAVMFDKYFLGEGKTFSIVFNKRYNNDMKRDQVIKALADLVIEKNVRNKVDLKNPELSVIVEIIKGKCCLSVVEGYIKYRKYNLVELGSAKADNNEKKEEFIELPGANGGGLINFEEFRRQIIENDSPTCRVNIIEPPVGNKLKELLERRMQEEEPNAKKFKEEVEEAEGAEDAEPEKIDTE